MARKRSIADELVDPATDTSETPAVEPEPAQEVPKPVRSRRAPRRPAAAPAEAPTAPVEDNTAKSRKPGPAVLAPDTVGDAFRISLYLHPDDGRTLELAKVDDRADHQARLRAMIALWRSNDRYRAAVDKLARTAPTPRGRK